jgi:PAS domain S-box-containing protein
MLRHLDAQALFDALPDAAIILDRSGRIKYMNPSASLLFQYKEEEVRGQPIEVLIPARFRIRHIAEREILLRNENLNGWGPHRRLMALRRDGSERQVLVRLSSLQSDSLNGILCLVHEYSEMCDLNRKSDEWHQLLRSMAWILEAQASAAVSLENFHEHVSALGMGLVPCFTRSIQVRDLIGQLQRLAQSHLERVAADLIVEEPCEDVCIQLSPSILILALLGFVKICLDAVAPLGERWVKIGLEMQEHRLLIAISDSAFCISEDTFTKNKVEFSVASHLLQRFGGEVLATSASPCRFSVSVPIGMGSV